MSTYRLEFLGKVYFLLLCVAFVVGQREVDISVYGDMVAKTDIAMYTVFHTDDDAFQTTLTISCTSFVQVSSTLTIVSDDKTLNTTTVGNVYNNRIVFEKVYRKSNVASSQGNYSCRLNTTFQANSGSFSYCVESEIQIKTTSSSRLCASSIGFNGYVGEKVTLTCEGDANSNYVNFFQGEWLKSQYFLQGNLLENTVFTCTKPRGTKLSCPHNFTVERSLEVKLSPSNFTVETNNTTFICESTPGRLLYWEIIGKDGNILDLQKLNQLRDVHTNVKITQKAGWSSLQISVLAAKQVNKIVCSTYGTRIRAVAYATLTSIPEDSKACPCNVPSSTHIPVSTFPLLTTVLTDKKDESSSEAEISTHFFQQTGIAKAGNIDVTQPSTSLQTWCSDVYASEQEANLNFWKVLALTTIVFCGTLVLLLIMTGIWSYSMYLAGRKNPPKTSLPSESGDNIISSETEMHENVLYLQYQ